jgi:eukaryotic-like serine/threonine-protein kinase
MRTPVPFGRWLLLDRVAIGGMAEVYVAVRQDASPTRLHALKRILPTLAEDGEFLAMFLDEARLVVQLDHPGVVPIHELGKHGDSYYMAMDYVAGQDLRAVVERARARGERLPVALAAYVAWRVADALDHAHRKRDGRGRPLQVVHRDVSPANVLLGFDGSVRVIDFGIAQAAIRTRHEETALRGKFGYMSPEMARGGPVDRRSDVFALGVVLHEMLTGERLFTGPSELAVLDAVRRAEAAPPSRRNPAVPPALDAVVLRALARESGDRFAWASELRDALAPFTHHGGVIGDPPALARHMAETFPEELRAELDRMDRVRRTGAAPPPETVPGEPTQIIALRGELASPREPPARDRRLHRAALAAAAATCVALAASIVLAATQPDPPAIAVPPPPALAAPRPPPPPAALVPDLVALPPRAGQGRLVVQPRAAAALLVDGIPRFPGLAAGEMRVLDLPVGAHRIELRTGDGRRAAATVDLRDGELSDLLGVEMQ